MSKKCQDKIIINKNYICTNIYTTRIVEIFLELQRAQIVKNISEFCKIIGYSASSWTLMSKGERGFPKKERIENILISNFCINPDFLKNGNKPIFINKHINTSYINDSYKLNYSSYNSLSDSALEYTYKNLPFISTEEQANISNDIKRLDYISNTYDFYQQLNESCYFYEVTSDNMLPKVHYGDIIVIEKVDKSTWETLKASNQIYVVFYKNIFTLKRIKLNQLTIKHIITFEDNLNGYIDIHLNDLKEIWTAKFIAYSKL